jgi:hypothetical protein
MRLSLVCTFGCALLLQGAVVAPAQSFSLSSASVSLARWMYPFNGEPTNRPNASVFAAFGSIPYFDTRDGQYLLGWNTANIPTNRGAANYLISHVRVTLTISSEGDQYAYDDQQRDYRTYFPTSDPNYLFNTNGSSAIELYGAGFRGGFTNSDGVYVPYSTATFQQGTIFFASPTGGDFTNRTAYAAGYDTNGVLVDVSDNVGDDGANEITNAFEVTPFAIGYNTNFTVGQLMPTGSPITFDLNLNDPLVYTYIQQGLNQGNLSFMISSLVNANYLSGGGPNWPDFYTIFDQGISPDEFPLLDMGVTVVRTNLDTDGDGLPDDWEQFYFGQLGVGASNSFTGDGLSNLSKYLAGTNPTNSAADFRVLAIHSNTNATELQFTVAPSRQYVIQWSADLQHWQTVTNPTLYYLSDWLTKTGPQQIPSAPIYGEWNDTNALQKERFYRIETK